MFLRFVSIHYDLHIPVTMVSSLAVPDSAREIKVYNLYARLHA